MDPRFPRLESDILALTEAMIAGYAAHGSDFPSVGGPELNMMRSAYAAARDVEMQAWAHAKLAREKRFELLDKLEELMKNWLTLSEADVANDPEKLAYIGWGPESMPRSTDIPGPPRNLSYALRGTSENGTLFFDWDPPVCRSGGIVQTYIIERREQSGKEQARFGPWKQVGKAIENEVTVIDQPLNVKLEYRVKAVNNCGESVPSDAVAVVL